MTAITGRPGLSSPGAARPGAAGVIFTVGVLTAATAGPGGSASTAALNTLAASDARGGPA